MQYISNTRFPPNTVGVVLTHDEQADAYFDEYMGIRDFHYTKRRPWETEGGVDKYDAHSKYVLLVESGHVVAGCRIISDVIGLPVRDVLREHGLPTDQIPEGSCEISRFVIHPDYLGKKETGEYVDTLARTVKKHCQDSQIPGVFAVMISVLEKWMQRLNIPVFPLSQPVTINHGDQSFRTVRLPTDE
ncbi:MAG: Acetyltransferase domain [Candidatus Parcubacteria bacterium]|jgi:N-acyl-L-homoserine lactone synthetase